MDLRKENKVLIIITTILTLLPMLAGVILWNRLPDQIATHFSSDGIPNGYSSKAFAVFLIPGVLLLVHLCMIFYDKIKNQPISLKLYRVLIFIAPVFSVIGGVAIYGNLLSK